jgi:hypothetical protein
VSTFSWRCPVPLSFMNETAAKAIMILVRDGTMYFFLIFLANLMNTLIFFASGSSSIFNFFVSLTWITYYTACPTRSQSHWCLLQPVTHLHYTITARSQSTIDIIRSKLHNDGSGRWLHSFPESKLYRTRADSAEHDRTRGEIIVMDKSLGEFGWRDPQLLARSQKGAGNPRYHRSRLWRRSTTAIGTRESSKC